MGKEKHTKTPWKVFYAKSNDDLIIGVGEETGEGIIASNGSFWGTDSEAKANAEHVVKCVNAHDELLEALERAKGYLKTSKNARQSGAYEQVLTAIKKAKGES